MRDAMRAIAPEFPNLGSSARDYTPDLTADVLRFDSTTAMPAALKYARVWNREIHTGDIFGWPTRILSSIFSLAVAGLAVTGALDLVESKPRAAVASDGTCRVQKIADLGLGLRQ